MPDQAALSTNCPDPDCGVPIGAPHVIDCTTAVCVMTGEQRILHTDNPPASDLPGVDVHVCGDTPWSGRLPGADEAAAHHLFVQPAPPPMSGWLPCPPGTPGAVPDLDRLVRTGRWNPIRQTWELPENIR